MEISVQKLRFRIKFCKESKRSFGSKASLSDQALEAKLPILRRLDSLAKPTSQALLAKLRIVFKKKVFENNPWKGIKATLWRLDSLAKPTIQAKLPIFRFHPFKTKNFRTFIHLKNFCMWINDSGNEFQSHQNFF